MSKSVSLVDANLQAIAQHHDVWLRMAYKVINRQNCEDQANELVQNFYLKMHKYLEKTDRKTIPSLYIYKMIRNLHLNQKKKKKWETPDEDRTEEQRAKSEVLGSDDAEWHENLTEDRKLISEALEDVPFIERRVLVLHQEMSQRAMQREYGVCRDRLRKYKNRGLEKLKEVLVQKYNVNPDQFIPT